MDLLLFCHKQWKSNSESVKKITFRIIITDKTGIGLIPIKKKINAPSVLI